MSALLQLHATNRLKKCIDVIKKSLTIEISQTLESNGISGRNFTSTASAWRRLKEPLPPVIPSDSRGRAQSDQQETSRGTPRPDLVEKYLSEETASRSERNAIHLRQVMKEFQLFEGDTGSSEVQIALLTHKIALLAEHLQDHKKDHSSRRGLYAMLNQRRKLLQYLRRTKFDSYAQLITKIGLKDSFAPQTKFTQRDILDVLDDLLLGLFISNPSLIKTSVWRNHWNSFIHKFFPVGKLRAGQPTTLWQAFACLPENFAIDQRNDIRIPEISQFKRKKNPKTLMQPDGYNFDFDSRHGMEPSS